MADFTTVLTGTAQVDDSIITGWAAGFINAAAQADQLTPLANIKVDLGAASININKYEKLALATTPLNEREDIASVALSDSKVTLTPAEYGTAVTVTQLASLQTGGKVDLAAAQMVGFSMGETRNQLATLALEASSNIIIPGAGTEAGLLAADVMTGSLLNKVYNKMKRGLVQPLPGLDGLYAASMHDDVIHDLREASGTGSWQDLSKFTESQVAALPRNAVGIFKGFVILSNSHASYGDQTGAGTVDAYKSSFFGFNGLGYAESSAPGLVFTGPFDTLGRFVNVGWKGTFQYKIVDTNAVWTTLTASSVGANAA